MIKQSHPQSLGALANLLQHVLDGVIVAVALTACLWLTDVRWSQFYTIALLLAITLMFLAAGTVGLYERSWRSISLPNEVGRILHAWVWVIVGLLIFAYVTKMTAMYSRLAMTSWFLLAPTLLIMWRVLGRLLLRRIRQLEGNVQRIVIAGAGELGVLLARAIHDHPGMGLRVQAFYDDALALGSTPTDDNELQVAGGLEQLIEDARRGQFDEVYIALPMHAEARIRHLLAGLADTPLQTYLVPDLFAFTLLHARMSDIAGMPVVSVYGSPHYGMGGFVKRAEDVLLSTLILTLISPVMLLIALGIKFSSPGPVLFRQRRYGLSGEQVVVWKFRTMNVAQDDQSVTQATRDDPRVTPIGRLLRRTSLDELPQFFNVLQGRMSIVGPRPHAVVHNEHYRQIIPGYMLRHIVKPGITGWAQVNGWRGETETVDQMQKRVEFDLEYIRNWSVWLDLKIILLTLFKGFVGQRAY